MTTRMGTGHTPFSLAFGNESMFLVELTPPSHRRETYDQGRNHKLIEESLDLIKERREKASLRVAAHQQKVARYFNSRVKDQKFQVGDLVLRSVFLNTKDATTGVLGPNWEGPYLVEKVIPPGTYKKAQLNGELIKNY